MSEMNMPIIPESDLRDLDVVTKQSYLMDLHKRAEQAEAALAQAEIPRAGEAQGCPNCEEVWPARLAEARGEIARLCAAYDRDVQVDPQQYSDMAQHAADLRATADMFEGERDAARAALDSYEAVYRRLGESSAYAKLDSDVWYAITKAHAQARATLEGRG